ncbi:hypothetical protein ACVWXU_001561 [Streptomyces sp. TE33382]
MRCCGSMLSASRGEILKKSASKQSACSMKPPQMLFVFWAPRFGSPKYRSLDQRSEGTSEMSERPARRWRLSSSSVSAPGNRRASPTIATSSGAGAGPAVLIGVLPSGAWPR